MTAPAEFSDTARFSHHIDDAYYDLLGRHVARLGADWPAGGVSAVADGAAFVFAEARLLDSRRFDEWVQLFDPAGLYWIPVTPDGGDPRREVSHAFDDVRRLTDRVFWLNTGLAYSQIPPSRTRRVIGNVEVSDDPESGLRFVRSNFGLREFRAGRYADYAGWYGHVLAPAGDGWRIRLKQVNLIDSDQGHENLTLVF